MSTPVTPEIHEAVASALKTLTARSAALTWEDLPEDFACELCSVGKEEFSVEE